MDKVAIEDCKDQRPERGEDDPADGHEQDRTKDIVKPGLIGCEQHKKPGQYWCPDQMRKRYIDETGTRPVAFNCLPKHRAAEQ